MKSSASQSDPERNHWLRRRWSDRPLTPRDLQHAADLELAHGKARRADLLAWAAHRLRDGVEAAR